MAQFWEIIYITSEFNFLQKKKKKKKKKAQFWAIMSINSEFNFMKKTKILLARFWAIIVNLIL